MQKIIFLLIVGLILFGCAATRITSFVDPDYQSVQFKKILIVGNTNKLDDRLNLEKRLSEVLSDNGIDAIPSYSIFPPTRTFSDSLKAVIMIENQIDGCLMIYFGDKGIQQVQIPVIGTRTKGQMNVIGNQIYSKEKTDYIGGQILDKPYAEFEMKLFDVTSGKMAWIADSYTGGNAYANFNTVYNSFCEKTVEKLSKDNLIITNDNKIDSIEEEINNNPEKDIIAVIVLKNGESYEGTIKRIHEDNYKYRRIEIDDGQSSYEFKVSDIKKIYKK